MSIVLIMKVYSRVERKQYFPFFGVFFNYYFDEVQVWCAQDFKWFLGKDKMKSIGGVSVLNKYDTVVSIRT